MLPISWDYVVRKTKRVRTGCGRFWKSHVVSFKIFVGVNGMVCRYIFSLVRILWFWKFKFLCIKKFWKLNFSKVYEPWTKSCDNYSTNRTDTTLSLTFDYNQNTPSFQQHLTGRKCSFSASPVPAFISEVVCSFAGICIPYMWFRLLQTVWLIARKLASRPTVQKLKLSANNNRKLPRYVTVTVSVSYHLR